MSRTLHVCLSVRGALRWSRRHLSRLFRTEDGRRYLTAHKAHEALCDELAKGREVIPIGDACEGFSYLTGCPGHETSEATP